MKFTIITVSLNCFGTIEKTIKSVIDQAYNNIEYIIIDGCSSDGTMQIIEKYQKYISCCISEPDDGIYDAMNKGISMSSGDVIAFMNSGDWYEPDIIGKINDIFENDNCSIVYGRVNKIIDNHLDGYVGVDGTFNPEDLHAGNLYCHQGLFVKREVFGEVGLYDTKYKILADYDWNLKAHNAGYIFHYINEVVANYVYEGISTTSRLTPLEYYQISLINLNGKKEYIGMIRSRYKEQREDRGIDIMIEEKRMLPGLINNDSDLYIWGVGYCGKQCYKLLVGSNYRIKGFIDSSPKIERLFDKDVYCKNDKENYINKFSKYVITPRGYEASIKAFLIENGVDEDRIIQYSKFLECADEYYSTKYFLDM